MQDKALLFFTSATYGFVNNFGFFFLALLFFLFHVSLLACSMIQIVMSSDGTCIAETQIWPVSVTNHIQSV